MNEVNEETKALNVAEIEVSEKISAPNWNFLNADKAPWLTKHIASIIALISFVLSFALFFVLVFYELNAEKKDIVIYILGVLSAIDTQIVSFYFGSSKESEVKNRMLTHQIMKK